MMSSTSRIHFQTTTYDTVQTVVSMPSFAVLSVCALDKKALFFLLHRLMREHAYNKVVPHRN